MGVRGVWPQRPTLNTIYCHCVHCGEGPCGGEQLSGLGSPPTWCLGYRVCAGRRTEPMASPPYLAELLQGASRYPLQPNVGKPMVPVDQILLLVICFGGGLTPPPRLALSAQQSSCLNFPRDNNRGYRCVPPFLIAN